jgi:hypothetical protein
MADPTAKVEDEPDTPLGGLPKPPGRDDPPPVPAPQPPPADTPAEFTRIAWRSYELIEQLSPAECEELLDAYIAFVDAVNAGSPDLEALGDALDDAFHGLHRPT